MQGPTWAKASGQLTSGLFAAILIAVAAINPGWGSVVAVGILVVGAASTIRGYSVMDGKLLIHRLGWATKFDLADLARVEATPRATMGSVRVMGIGGLFGFVGHFYNQILGSYKAYATDDLNTVAMVFDGETIVVTPDDAQAFVEAVQAASPSA